MLILIVIYWVLFISLTNAGISRMCPNPFYIQIHGCGSKVIGAYNSVIVSTNIKYHPVTAFAKNICRSECFFDIWRNSPICHINQGQPMFKGNSSACIRCGKIQNGFPFDKADSHFVPVKITKTSQKVNFKKIVFLSISKLGKINYLAGS